MNIESHSLDDLLQEVDNDSFYDSQHETERFKEIIEKLTLRNYILYRYLTLKKQYLKELQFAHDLQLSTLVVQYQEEYDKNRTHQFFFNKLNYLLKLSNPTYSAIENKVYELLNKQGNAQVVYIYKIVEKKVPFIIDQRTNGNLQHPSLQQPPHQPQFNNPQQYKQFLKRPTTSYHQYTYNNITNKPKRRFECNNQFNYLSQQQRKHRNDDY